MADRNDFLGIWKITLTTNDQYALDGALGTIEPDPAIPEAVRFVGEAGDPPFGAPIWDGATALLVDGLLTGVFANGQRFGIAFEQAPVCLPAPKNTIVFIASGPVSTGTWTAEDDG